LDVSVGRRRPVGVEPWRGDGVGRGDKEGGEEGERVGEGVGGAVKVRGSLPVGRKRGVWEGKFVGDEPGEGVCPDEEEGGRVEECLDEGERVGVGKATVREGLLEREGGREGEGVALGLCDTLPTPTPPPWSALEGVAK